METEPSKKAMELAEKVDLECTRADDHDYKNCEKCARLRRAIAARIADALRQECERVRRETLEELAACVEVKRYEINDQRHQSGRPHVVIFGFALKGRNSRTEAHAQRRAQRLKDAIRALAEQQGGPDGPSKEGGR